MDYLTYASPSCRNYDDPQAQGFPAKTTYVGAMGEVRVGICAWADPALIEDGSFYPKKSMTAEARLRWYARSFDTVEINSSYYAIPAARNAVQWAERTPPGFIFNVKAYALMTGHHVRPHTLPAELQLLLPRHPRLTRRGEIEASAFPPE